MSETSRRISPIERLRMLDPVFSLGEMQSVCGLEYGLARLYATRWTEKGYTRRFGQGVYFNLIRDENAPETRRHEALRKLLGVPFVLVGGAAIHSAGWTTQNHQRFEIAVPVTQGRFSLPSTEGDVMLTPRYVGWFKKLEMSAGTDHGGGMPTASPEYALADALLSARRGLPSKRPVYAPPPDEIDMAEFDGDAFERLREALFDLGANEEELAELAEPYGESVTDSSKLISY